MKVKDRNNPLIEQENSNQFGKHLHPSDFTFSRFYMERFNAPQYSEFVTPHRSQDKRGESKKIANVPFSSKRNARSIKVLFSRLSFVSNSILRSAKQNSGKESMSGALPEFEYFTTVKSSNQSNLQITQTLLLELLQEEKEDDYGILRPTTYAFNNTWNLLENVSEILETEFPKAWACTDENGGISLTWSNVESNARVSLKWGASPEKQTYIYYEHGDVHGLVKEVSESSLAEWIKWLNQV